MHYKRDEPFRYQFKQPIQAQIDTPTAGVGSCKIINVSPSGMKIRTNLQLSLSENTYIQYSILDEFFQVNGNVVWTMDYGDYNEYGLSLQSSDDYKNSLVETLKKLARIQLNN